MSKFDLSLSKSRELIIEGIKGSFDYKFYSKVLRGIFGNFEPCGSQKCIIEIAKNKNAYSLQDRDYKDMEDSNLDSIFTQNKLVSKENKSFKLKHTEIENILLLAIDEKFNINLKNIILSNLNILIEATAIRIVKSKSLEPFFKFRYNYLEFNNCNINLLLRDINRIEISPLINRWKRVLKDFIDNNFDKAMIILSGKDIWKFIENCDKYSIDLNKHFKDTFDKTDNSEMLKISIVKKLKDDIESLL